MRNFFATLTRSPVGLAGAAVTTASAVLIITLFGLELVGFHGSPYLGILAYLVLPGLFVLGLLIIPFGVWRQRRREARAERAGETRLPFPVLDLNRQRVRSAVLIFLVLTMVNVIILSLAGLVAFARRHPRDAWPLAFVVLAAWYVNAAVADWWAGEAFGARRFLSLFPLFVLGLATWIRPAGAEDDPPRWRLGAIAALVAVTWLLLLQYQVFMKGYPDIAPYPKGAFEFWVARFVVPFRLIAAWFA